jgi:uncharacterized protein (TIGR01777 family)
MKITLTGASGLIGTKLVRALLARGDEVTVLSRDPGRAQLAPGVEGVAWDPLHESAPVDALTGADAVIHLAGEPVAQRCTATARNAILASRATGTANLVAGLREAHGNGGAAKTLVSASAVGYYGRHGDERLTEDAEPGDDFLADVCVAWEREANVAGTLGLRVVTIRTGVVLDADGGALAKMMLPFKLGIGGPVAGGRQYMPWIAADDLVALYLAALDDERYRGAVNGAAPEPVTNSEFSKALGRALHRPAIAPIPGFAIRALYGDMAEIVTEGQRAVPARALSLGFTFAHPDLDEALAAALA